jgi:beta-lactamase class A
MKLSHSLSPPSRLLAKLRVVAAVGGLVLATTGLRAQATPSDVLAQKTQAQLEDYGATFGGVLGVMAIDLTSGQVLAINADVPFAQASSIKIPIMVELFRAARAGELSLDTNVTLTEADVARGSGRLNEQIDKGPVSVTVRALLEAMIQHSDNTATNKLIALVGMERVNALMASLGLPNTRLQRIMLDATGAARRNIENISTPREMAQLAEMIHRERFPDSTAMIEILKLPDADGWQLAGGGFRGGIPREVPIASKPGSVRGVQCQTGIVLLANRPFVLSVMAVYLPENASPVADVARIAFAHFSTLAVSNQYGSRVR